MSSPFRNITLTPASSPSDFHQISTLENHVFYNDPFTIVAFGPTRDSAENIEKRAKGLAKQPRNPGDREIVMMAIEGEDVVGGAAWSFVRHRDEEEKQEEEKQAEKEGASDDLWGIGANVKFCEDVFLVADVHMARSCHGQAYAKLSTLIVSPSHQRRGIGSQLLEQGLKQVDETGLQCVLAASNEGLELYKRWGFVESERMVLQLGIYEGGKGMEDEAHVVMHRPAKEKEGGVN